MASNQDDDTVKPELLEQLVSYAQVLEVYDEGQSIALKLHTHPFDAATRDECHAFFSSTRYLDALSVLDAPDQEPR